MGKCLHELVEEQALKTPDSPALLDGDRGLTYRELNGRANHMALILRERGIGPETTISIYMEKSLEAIVCILGILKSGAAYVPIDAEIPRDRACFMLKDSGTALVITDQETFPEMSRLEDIPEVIRADWLHGYAEAPQAATISKPEHLAYMIYTSGSTGTPKGVMIEHGSIVNTIEWRKAYYGFSESDSILQFASLSFDSSVEDIFTALASGARLVLLPHQLRNDLRYVRNLLKDRGITNLLAVPSFYKVLLDECPEALQSLTKVTLAGESFSKSLLEKHYRIAPHISLYNEYGPTENSVCSTIYKFSGPKDEVKIGLPISNVGMEIVTSTLEPCPPGTEGELLVYGPGLARGYLNRPDLTDKAFIQLPDHPQTRLYRTGDLVRMDETGQLIYLGRMDRQIKLRGHRIELGEIEFRITQASGVKDAVATLVDIQDTPIICAYYVSDVMIDESILLAHLSSSLPDYMVPAFLMRINRIPLTPNGKTDFASLPHPIGAIENEEGDASGTPLSPTAERLHYIMNDLLNNDGTTAGRSMDNSASITERLDSLGLMRLLVRMETEFGLDIEMKEWEALKTSNIEGLAAFIDKRLALEVTHP